MMSDKVYVVCTSGRLSCEAQRAWDLEQTANFMVRKKKVPGFSQSEPEFLISYMDRHKDWALIVCLVGGGQEINRGEAGIEVDRVHADELIARISRHLACLAVHVAHAVLVAGLKATS